MNEVEQQMLDEAMLRRLADLRIARAEANEVKIKLLVENRRTAEQAHAEKIASYPAEDAAVEAARAAHAESVERGRQDARRMMQELGGEWPDDLKPVEAAPHDEPHDPA